MSIFGWSYPPGCSGPPEAPEPSAQSQEVHEILEDVIIAYERLREAMQTYPEWTEDGSGTQYGSDECPHCEAMRQDGHAEDCPFLLSRKEHSYKDIIEKVVGVIDDLEAAAERECPHCERRALEAQREAEQKAEEYWASLPAEDLCQHKRRPMDCNPCLVAADMAHDAARERAHR